MKIINFPEPKTETIEPNKNVIACLKKILEHAESGEIQEISVIGLMRDDSVWKGFAVNGNAFTMLGAVEHLKLSYMADRFYD